MIGDPASLLQVPQVGASADGSDACLKMEDAGSSSLGYPELKLSEDSFRLLHLLPSESDQDIIQCKFIAAKHSEWTDRYIAGSYVWGPPSPQRMILVNNTLFPVGENLHMFLSCFRKVNGSHWLWIDAICIKQDSIRERNHQVRMMGKIFENAACVYAWLGPSTPETEWLFDNLWDIPKPNVLTIPRRFVVEENYKPEGIRRIETGLEQISQRKYWER